jgi:hypothetical protein
VAGEKGNFMCEPRALEVKTGVVGSDGRAGEASQRLAALEGEIVVLIASEEPPETPRIDGEGRN